jgi:hypothetical protein
MVPREITEDFVDFNRVYTRDALFAAVPFHPKTTGPKYSPLEVPPLLTS